VQALEATQRTLRNAAGSSEACPLSATQSLVLNSKFPLEQASLGYFEQSLRLLEPNPPPDEAGAAPGDNSTPVPSGL
jgi:hypothetical protein